MHYQGGKFYSKNEICKVIHTHTHTHTSFVSLFCGSCAIESKVNFGAKILNDKHFYLIEMYKGLQNGYILPDTISEEEYKYIRGHKDEDPVLTGFVGFACSFGGKWFGGYARDRRSRRNYCDAAKRSLERDMLVLKNATFLNMDYRDVPIQDGSVVYCDPPYRNTTQYGEKFDSDEFWEYMRKISINNTVFISEQEAPEDFACIWEKEQRRTVDVNKSNNQIKIEKLFVFRND